MNNNLAVFVIFWGVWILIPILVDGVYFAVQALTVLIKGQRVRVLKDRIPEEKIPLVSIIIPTFNEEQNIDECLNFLKIQTYPHQKIEIIIVDNGSSDKTAVIVKGHVSENNIGFMRKDIDPKLVFNSANYHLKNNFANVRLLEYHRQNKAHALNLGLERAEGEIIINIDCRSRLAPEAVYQMVAKFLREPDLGACTGNIEITWQPSQALGQDGRVKFLKDGFTQHKPYNFKEEFLAKCQFLEYLTSFRIGRDFLASYNAIYTLSGAFSAFRRKSLRGNKFYSRDNEDYLQRNKEKVWYSDRTVTEDTDLTLSLQDKRIKIGYAPYAKVYLKPVVSWQRLYSQRVRWHRGELEVYGLHSKMIDNPRHGIFGQLFFPLTLAIDHTLTFPRIIWTSLLPLLIFFGYSPKIIFSAIVLMIIFYILVDFTSILFCYPIVDRETKIKIKKTLHYGLVLSSFRFVVFYFRFSGFLIALKEEPRWMADSGPIASIKGFFARIAQSFSKKKIKP